MKYYLAPLEGITTYIYRNAYHSIFHPMDKYFTPFIVPRMKKGMNHREKNDILPEHNEGLYVVPQLLTNRAEDFIKTAHALEDYGYREINLNLGCPSGTVAAKGRGAGFLAHPRELNQFLEEIFTALTLDISIKTRIGVEDAEEFEILLKIFNQYPLKELIIHPRVQKDYYKNKPNFPVFEKAWKQSKNPICYNGNLFSKEDCQKIQQNMPNLPAVMLGRGVIANPHLPGECLEIEKERDSSETLHLQKRKKEALQSFHGQVLEGYREILSGERNVLFKMKEIWSYMIHSFSNYESYKKKIQKSETLQNYEAVVRSLFREQDVVAPSLKTM